MVKGASRNFTEDDGMSNKGGTNTVNKFKMEMENPQKPAPVGFRPMRQVVWPAAPHPRQAEIDAQRNAVSQYQGVK